MTHQNLVLTEKAIKNHSKRLQKELKSINKDISLGETQNLFSKALGFNSFHELKKVLNGSNKKNLIDKNSISEKFLKFIEEIEHKSSYLYFFTDGEMLYKTREDNKKHFVKSIFNTEELNIFIESIISKIDNFDEQMDRKILLVPSKEKSYSLSVKEKQKVDDGLFRDLIYLVYFDNNKKIDGVKVIIQYMLKGDYVSLFYEDIKHLFIKENTSLKMSEEAQKRELRRWYYLKEESIEKDYLNMFKICMNENLIDFKNFVKNNPDINLNKKIDGKTWEPKSAIELALSFDKFDIVNYLIDNFEKMKIDLHISDDYLLRHCCLYGTNEHFKVVKKLFKKTSFKHIPNELVQPNNLISLAYKKNINLAKYLEGMLL